MTLSEQRIWQAVIHLALLDATPRKPKTRKKRPTSDQRLADSWLRSGGKDFRTVCALAGADADYLRDAYVMGRICPEALRSARSPMTNSLAMNAPHDPHMRMAAE